MSIQLMKIAIAMDRAGALPGQISCLAVEFVSKRCQPGADVMVPERVGKLAVVFRVVAEVCCIVHLLIPVNAASPDISASTMGVGAGSGAIWPQ
jgi:hypothetical protein